MKDGIIYVYVKPLVATEAAMQESYAALRKLSGGSNALIIVNPKDGVALDKKQRRTAAKVFNEFTKGMVMIDNNFLTKLVFSLVMKQEKLGFQMKLFKTEEAGVKWLKSL